MVTKDRINRSSQSVVVQIKDEKLVTHKTTKTAKKFLTGDSKPNFPSCNEYLFVAFAALL